MTRAGLIFGSAVAVSALLSVGVYAMKYEVERLDDQVAAVQRKIAAQEETLLVLEAEWSFLNRPERLQELANRNLSLKPVAVRQIGAIEALPLRASARSNQDLPGARTEIETRIAARTTESRDPPLRLTPAVSPAQANPAGKWEVP